MSLNFQVDNENCLIVFFSVNHMPLNFDIFRWTVENCLLLFGQDFMCEISNPFNFKFGDFKSIKLQTSVGLLE